MTSPLGVALLGGGIFATQAHLPALFTHRDDIFLRAVWSRSSSSSFKAQQAAISLGFPAPETYSETNGSQGLDVLLSRNDIHAVVVALPIASQPEVVLTCLKAGKHVLSEKPVGVDVKSAKELLSVYLDQHKPKGLVWRVAENWEVEEGYRWAAKQIRDGLIGKIRTFSLEAVLYVHNENNQYLETEWRKNPTHQGGFMLDAGVHNAAALRVVLPSTITSVSGFTSLGHPHLAPVDLIQAVAKCEDGTIGHFCLDYGASGQPARNDLQVHGTEGSMVVSDVYHEDGSQSLKTVLISNKAEESDVVKEFPKRGVENEQALFFSAIQGKTDNDYGNPSGAMYDVAFIQAVLQSEGQEIHFSLES